MAYPFLPVNPCCTDVVINDPCGCSSTITNSGCNNNNPCSTHLTASSTIVYDGPVLPCIVAEPCDTLNVILQKIDEIICNLLTQINILVNQVNNINIQINNINGDIINIYDILDECCGATTTTTSTTIAVPCESFSLDNTGDVPVAIIITDCNTGEQDAIVLLPGETNICVETDSPLTVPGTVIVTPNGPCGPTTTTTTTIPPTTTTTTTAFECQCFTFFNSDTSAHVINYKNCNGVNIGPIFIDSNETLQVCAGSGSASDPLVTISVGANCIDGLCPVEPTTTTTTTIAPCNCFDTEVTILSETLATTDDGQITVLYNDCFNNPYIDTYDRPGVYPLGCVDYLVGIVALGQVDGVESSIYVPITVGSPCCDVEPTTTTTTTAPILVLELIGCCVDETKYVLYNPALATIPSVFTATNGQPYELVSATPIVGVPTVTITDFTNYNTCANWLAINLNCPGTTTTTTTVPPTTTTTTTILDCSFTGTANELPDTTTTTTSSSSSTSTTTTTTTAMMVLELVGCCTSQVQYVLYDPVLVSSIPAVFVATDGQPYEVNTGSAIPGTPTVVIADTTDYDSCANWLTIFGSCPTSTTTTTNTTAPPAYVGQITNNTSNTITANTAFIKVNGGMVAAVTNLNIAPGATQTFSTSYTVPVMGIGNDFTLELYTYTGVNTSNDMTQSGGNCVTTVGGFVNAGTYLTATSTTTGPTTCSVFVINMTIV